MLENLKIIDISDSVIGFNFSRIIDTNINANIHQIENFVSKSKIAGLISHYPTYNSLIINYDFQKTSRKKLIDDIKKIIISIDFVVDNEENLLEIPVAYGGKDGPDLHNISEILKLREEEIIKIHSGTKYHVFMLGFSPGFPYLGELDERLECPRLPTPRITVPAGSVGIADKQTGIYPLESPGGWRIIGRTSLKMFDLEKENFSLIKPGMKIKFKPL